MEPVVISNARLPGAVVERLSEPYRTSAKKKKRQSNHRCIYSCRGGAVRLPVNMTTNWGLCMNACTRAAEIRLGLAYLL